LVEVQPTVVELLRMMMEGFVVTVTVGAGVPALTVSVTLPLDGLSKPPVPGVMQYIVYVVVVTALTVTLYVPASIEVDG
jgi:hypothetical protein